MRTFVKYTCVLSFLLLCALQLLQAQTPISIQLIMTPNPTPYVSDWRNQSNTARLIVTNTGAETIVARIRTTIALNGQTVAATRDAQMDVIAFAPGTTPLDPVDVFPLDNVNFVGNIDDQVLRSGRLPSGSYQICVDLLNPQTLQTITPNQVCRPFRIITLRPPFLVFPANRQVLHPQRERRPIFRWTPVNPSPLDGPASVRYVLQVFEVMPGQRPVQAFRANLPLVELETQGLTSIPWPPDFELPRPGTNYIWNVRALDTDGNPLGEPDGYAEPFVFSVDNLIPPGGLEESIDPFAIGDDKTMAHTPWADVDFSAIDSKDAGLTFTPRMIELKDNKYPSYQNFAISSYTADQARRPSDLTFWSLPPSENKAVQAVPLNGGPGVLPDLEDDDKVHVLIPTRYTARPDNDSSDRRSLGYVRRMAMILSKLYSGELRDFVAEAAVMPKTQQIGITPLDESISDWERPTFDLTISAPLQFRVFFPRQFQFETHSDEVFLAKFAGEEETVSLSAFAADADTEDERQARWQSNLSPPVLPAEWRGFETLGPIGISAEEGLRHVLTLLVVQAKSLDKDMLQQFIDTSRRFGILSDGSLAFNDWSADVQAAGQSLINASTFDAQAASVSKTYIDWFIRSISMMLQQRADRKNELSTTEQLMVLAYDRPGRELFLTPYAAENDPSAAYSNWAIDTTGKVYAESDSEIAALRAIKKYGAVWIERSPEVKTLLQQLKTQDGSTDDVLLLRSAGHTLLLGNLLKSFAFADDGPLLLISSDFKLLNLPLAESALVSFRIEQAEITLDLQTNSMTLTQDMFAPNGLEFELHMEGIAGGSMLNMFPPCSGDNCQVKFRTQNGN